MPRRVANYLLAVALIVAVGAMGAHAAAHAHTSASDEQHCQACHIGQHVAIPQHAPPAAVRSLALIARLTPVRQFVLNSQPVCNLSGPRAPPA
jgi:hypothetical protein